MQQEVLDNKEVEFESKPSNKMECPRCHKHKNKKCFIFNKVLNLTICKSCNKSVGTNKFYNPDWKKNKNFISKTSMSNTEKQFAIINLQRQGLSLFQAKNRVFGDIRVMRGCQSKKTQQDATSVENLAIKEKTSKELNKKLAEGLGFKRR